MELFVFDREYEIIEIKGDRAVVTYNGIVVTDAHKDNLVLVTPAEERE